MRTLSLRLVCCVVFAGFVAPALASVVGTNPPSHPLTEERVRELPAAQRRPWQEYLDRSQRLMQVDKDTLKAEQAKAGSIPPPATAHAGGGNARSIPLDRDAAWYATPEALHIADVVLSYQTPAGGWSKNIDMSRTARLPGQSYASGPDRTASLATPDDYGRIADPHWDYIGTIDNDATVTQLQFLPKVVTALGAGSAKAAPYRKAFLHGLEYLMEAQYPNGGWPQVYPLSGGYHDGITFNDDAMIQVMELLKATAAGRDEFAFVPAKTRAQAQTAVEKGIDCILKTQIVVHGTRTAWGQQYDPITLEPASARNYEMPSESAGESAGILLFLMDLPHPTAAEVSAIRGAGDWLTRVAIRDSTFSRTPQGRDLLSSQGAPLLWARYYQIGTDRPLFGDRDKSIHDKVSEISTERRNGYAWYSTGPQKAVTEYAQWRATHPA